VLDGFIGDDGKIFDKEIRSCPMRIEQKAS